MRRGLMHRAVLLSAAVLGVFVLATGKPTPGATLFLEMTCPLACPLTPVAVWAQGWFARNTSCLTM